jgi:hypothetical protein
MDYAHWDLGQQSSGSVVQVNLSGNAANVRLLDSANLQSYRARRSHRAVGGYYTRSPIVLQVPATGHWHVVIDYGGAPGRGRATVQVLPARRAS